MTEAYELSRKIFRLYSCCINVKGYSRSLIYDLQRATYETIPNSLNAILQNNENAFFEDIIKKYGNENEIIIATYFDWLEKNEYGFWCRNIQEISRFPNINYKWDMPFEISNSIIDLNSISNIKEALKQLANLYVPHIQLRSFSIRSSQFYMDLLLACDNTRIKTIEIFTPYTKLKSAKSGYIDLLKKFMRLESIIFYNAHINRKISYFGELSKIIYTKQNICSASDCGSLQSRNFTINLPLFTESQHYNTCLNRKICIDENGEIKNCPAMSRSFGNIKDTTLEEALNKPEFKDLWGIRKDDIDVCKDCEFRYMCTDCRCFIRNPEDIYSQPAKCTYNPYIALWEGEEGFISVEEWRRLNPHWEKKAKRHPLVKVPQSVENN